MAECKTDEYGNKYWYKNSELHREDGPAVEWVDGTKSWWINGKRHRENGPAIESTNGYKEWHVHGLRHREDGPAIEDVDGYKAWYINGKPLSLAEYCIKLYGSLDHPKSIMLQVKYG